MVGSPTSYNAAIIFCAAISQHLPYSRGRIGLENLVKVGGCAVVRHGGVTEDGVGGLLFRNRRDGFSGYARIEASQQEAVRHVEHLLAADFRLGNCAGRQPAQLQHDLEQQVFRCAVGLDVIRREGK